jgi:hypothetical protein
MSAAPSLRVREVLLYERPVRLRMPFRFGVVTLDHGVQAFVRARVSLGDGREAWGVAAEMLAPKWFDKDLTLTDDDNEEQLRDSLRIARALYLAEPARSAFALYAATYRSQFEMCAARKLNSLIAGYGPAVLDRAVLDALCRILGMSFYDAVAANVPGVEVGTLTPDLAGFDVDAYLRTLSAADTIHARHTVGLVDPITAGDLADAPRADDGLPETLADVVETYGHAYYKVKVGGDVRQDVERLTAIARVLDTRRARYHVTLDGNEQYDDVDAALELWRTIDATPPLRRLAASTIFIEQPIRRTRALDADVSRLAAHRPVIIDESDAEIGSFVLARARGYTGVSSKTCKGLYKSILNRARCARWNRDAEARYFMSAEDLTTQAGPSVQQDLAFAALLGLEHVEKNGHHYVNGMAASPPAEQQAFLAAHPDLYHRQDGVVRLRIREGQLAIASLRCAGFAVGADLAFDRMRAITS